MNRFKRSYWIFTLAMLLTGCTSDVVDYGLGDFRIDLATVTSDRNLLLDNQVTLTPTNIVIPTDYKANSRVMVNYRRTETSGANSYKISINSIAAVNSSTIKPITQSLPDDPILAESLWIGGDWLNLRIGFEYFGKTHSMELAQRIVSNSDTIYLELHHAKNGDTPGYWVKTYLSFPIKSYAKKGVSVPIKLRVNSAKEGIKYFRFDYLSPTQN